MSNATASWDVAREQSFLLRLLHLGTLQSVCGNRMHLRLYCCHSCTLLHSYCAHYLGHQPSIASRSLLFDYSNHCLHLFDCLHWSGYHTSSTIFIVKQRKASIISSSIAKRRKEVLLNLSYISTKSVESLWNMSKLHLDIRSSLWIYRELYRKEELSILCTFPGVCLSHTSHVGS